MNYDNNQCSNWELLSRGAQSDNLKTAFQAVGAFAGGDWAFPPPPPCH